MSIAVTRYCGADRKLMTDLRKWISGMTSYRPRDATVFADAPEMDRHQEGGHERNSDAMQNVEPQERPRSDETAAQKAKAGVVGRGHERDIPDLEKPGAGPLDADQRRGGSHVGA